MTISTLSSALMDAYKSLRTASISRLLILTPLRFNRVKRGGASYSSTCLTVQLPKRIANHETGAKLAFMNVRNKTAKTAINLLSIC